MLSAIKWVIKAALFSVLVLVLGNWIRIGNRTVSDQVRTEMAHAENLELLGKVRSWAERLTADLQRSVKKEAPLQIEPISAGSMPERREKISPTERQKLKALMRELNSPSRAD